jgi:hypothetical protein
VAGAYESRIQALLAVGALREASVCGKWPRLEKTMGG